MTAAVLIDCTPPVEAPGTSFKHPDPAERAAEAITECAAELLLRAQGWALLHAHRADGELPSGAAAFAEAADTFGELSDEVHTYGFDGILQAARAAYWKAFRVTELESHHELSNESRHRCRQEALRALGVTEAELASRALASPRSPITGDPIDELAGQLNELCREAEFAELCKQPGFAALHEAEASAIREICNALGCVIQHYGEMIDGTVAPLEARGRATEELLAAPSSPSIQDIIQCE
jgi:hypothetical protein